MAAQSLFSLVSILNLLSDRFCFTKKDRLHPLFSFREGETNGAKNISGHPNLQRRQLYPEVF